MGEPNVLLLDEPTNDLDTDTLAAIEDTLDEWPGTLIVVSHDRYLLERVCDTQVALLGDGRIRDLPGGVEEYLSLRAARQDAPSSSREAVQNDAGQATVPDPGTGNTVSPGEARAARKELAKLERQISKLTARETKLHAEMALKATDHTAVQSLDAELRALIAEREQLEEAWLEAADVAG
jgi:ATP-binding cassette subfamily F protein uup